jgi:hypothetical protein
MSFDHPAPARGQWDAAAIPQLLLQLSSAMADEVETLAAFEPEQVP